MSDLQKLVDRCNEMDITEQINWLGDAIMPMNAAAELAAKDAALAAAKNALEKSDPWKQISTEPSFEFECIHCGEKYDMMAEFRDNHAADCIWLSAALSAAIPDATSKSGKASGTNGSEK